jgi:two-component system response regulator CpxR
MPAATQESDVRILLIDDDVELCALMKEFFTAKGMHVEAANDGRRGLSMALEGGHDVLLLDAMMPYLDGFELLRQLRTRSKVPVIMLTARTDGADRIAGLEAGADDYLPKPFSPPELAARIGALMRRSNWSRTLPKDTLEVNGVRLDPGSRTAYADARAVELTGIEYEILELLLRNAGRAISRDELMTILYQRESTPFDRSIDVHVSRLRKKLGPERTFIRSIRGVGYLFCTAAQSESEIAAEADAP